MNRTDKLETPKQDQLNLAPVPDVNRAMYESGLYDQIYRHRIGPERTIAEVQGIVTLLGLDPEHTPRVLDLCGGQGRISVGLAQRGYEVVDLDYTPLHLELAKEAAKRVGVSIEVVEADFTQIPPLAPFDAVVNIFTSGFAHVERETDRRAMRAVWGALKSGGKFLLDTMCRPWLHHNYHPSAHEWAEDGTLLIVEDRHFDFAEGANWTDMTLIREGQPFVRVQQCVRPYNPDELKAMAETAGFSEVRLYGSFQGEPADDDHHSLILVATK
jgi:SAM-dependent methyltransferase